jgi:hypothetical protein
MSLKYAIGDVILSPWTGMRYTVRGVEARARRGLGTYRYHRLVTERGVSVTLPLRPGEWRRIDPDGDPNVG